MSGVLAAIAALTPPVGVALLFWFVMRAVVRADRTEREAMAELDRLEAERVRHQRTPGAPPPGTGL